MLRLETAKVEVRPTEIAFAASHCKGKQSVFKGQLPIGYLRLPDMPDIYQHISYYILECKKLTTHMLFDIPGSGQVTGWFNKRLASVYCSISLTPRGQESHSFRRGTCSVLWELGMPLERINLHVGWSVASSSFKTYRRAVRVVDMDRRFFRAVLDIGDKT